MSKRLLELWTRLISFMSRKGENKDEKEILKQEEYELGLGWRRAEKDSFTSNEDDNNDNNEEDDRDDGFLVSLY